MWLVEGGEEVEVEVAAVMTAAAAVHTALAICQ